MLPGDYAIGTRPVNRERYRHFALDALHGVGIGWVHMGLVAGTVFRHRQRPEQQLDVSLVPPVGLLDSLTAPCADPVAGENGFQFHGVLSCDIAPIQSRRPLGVRQKRQEPP